MRRIALGFGVFFLVSNAALLAQQASQPQPPKRPDFSGVWIQLSPARGAGNEDVVKQTDKTLTIGRASGGDGFQLVLNLDGSEAHSSQSVGSTTIATVSKVTWSGNRMTATSTSTTPQGVVVNQTMVWSIDDKGQLVIDHTAVMPGIPTETTQVVYKKKAPAPPAAQKPNFSGTWIQQQPALGAGGQQIVVHTEKELSVAHASEGDGHRLVYKLDGTEATSSMQSHGMDIVTTSKAEWKDDRLVITSVTTYPMPTLRTLNQTMVWWFDASGQLIVDLTQEMTGKPVESTKIVYKKK
jgi:hypothetical protein